MKKKKNVRPERFGTRNLHFSKWHRECADSSCYMTDMDCIEYRKGRECVALLEVKWHPGNLKKGSSQQRALSDLAERSGLPLFFVTYWFSDGKDDVCESYRFKVKPLNEKAQQLTPECGMSSKEFAAFLNRL